jgi:predicted small lipoprotein YifL
MRRAIITLLIGLALVVSVSACGKKGPLEPPPSEQEDTA